MKNVTFRADGGLLKQARAVARSQHSTLNAAFREWLGEYASGYGSAREVDALMKRLRHVQVGRALTREEMNTR
jgi:hypothetical protein